MKGVRIVMLTMAVIIHAGVNAQNSSGARLADEANFHQVKIVASSIIIHGKTNVNKFKCGLDQQALNDSIIVKNIWSNKQLDFEGLRLIYNIEDFECGLKLMDADFQKLLRSDEEPFLLLQLNSITLYPENDAFEELDVDAEVEIILAGVQRRITIPRVKVFNHSSAHMTLKGKKNLQMTEFELDPPTKFLGMIKVTDEIKIEFEIAMKVSML